MPGPQRLVDWPWVVLRVECEPCRYHAAYRLARLAEKYGAEASLAELLERVRVKCRLIDRGGPRRQPDRICSIRYRVPAGGPLPDGVPAREFRPGEPPPLARRRRREPDGPLPTVGDVIAEGCPAILLYCAGRKRDGYLCHHQGRMDLTALGLPPDLPFIHITRVRRLRCSHCGSRNVEVRSDRPSPQEAQARRMSGGEEPMVERNGILVPEFGAKAGNLLPFAAPGASLAAAPHFAVEDPAMPDKPDPELYEIIQEDDGTYAVVHCGTGKIVEFNGVPQRGLKLTAADDAADALEALERIAAARGTGRMDS